MKTSILLALLATSMFAQSEAKLDREFDADAGPAPGQVASHFKVQVLHESAGQIRNEVLRAMAAEPALKEYARSAAWPIHVIVRRSVVTLEGFVDSDATEIQAGVAADSVPAVSRVLNHLRVVSAETSTAESTKHQNSTSSGE